MKQEKENPTIKDVAALANVSIGTVSRFINGYKLKEANQKAVKQAIETLNYRTDQFARSMKTGKSSTVGLLVSGYDQFSTEVLSIMAELFGEKGYTLVTYHHKESSAIFDNVFQFFIDRHFDGIAFSGVDCRKDQVENYIAKGKAMAVFNNDIPDLDLDRILVKDQAAARLATSYLIQMNHKRIAIITGNLKDSTGRNRLNGYKEALEEREIPFDESLVIQGNWSETSGYFGIKELMKREKPPTALFTSNYLMTMGVLKGLKELKLSIPEDISLVSFDDPSFFDILTPAITAISQPTEQVAKNVSQSLLDRIEGSYTGPGREILLDCQLILRESVKYSN